MERRTFFGSCLALLFGTRTKPLVVPVALADTADSPDRPALTSGAIKDILPKLGEVPVTIGWEGERVGHATNWRFDGKWLTATLWVTPEAAKRVNERELHPGPRVFWSGKEGEAITEINRLDQVALVTNPCWPEQRKEFPS